MCRIDERVYVRTDGHESVFQDTVMCERGRSRGKMCSDARTRRTTYPDPTSSPVASSPVTPAYNTRTRRPSTSSRPSTRDGPITSIGNEIHIEIGSKKGKGKSYMPTVSITTGKAKRSSTGSTSGSEPSHTVRTGFPDMSPPPLEPNRGGLRPRLREQRLPSSDESFSGSSRVPSLYRTSDDYDTPSLVTTTTGASSVNQPIIHNGPRRHVPSPIDSTRGHSSSPSSPYRTTEFKPSKVLDETPARAERNRHDSSYAPEILGRDEDRQRRRDEKRRQEALDRDLAASVMHDENQKHVRFESRTKLQAGEQPKNSFAAHEARRQGKKDQEARASKEAEAKEASSKRSTPSASSRRPRRESVQLTAAQAAEQQHLVAAEAYQMQQERIKAEAIEREEGTQRIVQHTTRQNRQPISLQEQQQDLGYYDPRGERTTSQPSGQTPIIRRPSQSGQQRPELGRRSSTRESNAPRIREDRRQPPVAYYNSVPLQPNLPSARERRPSLSHATNPFAPPTPTTDPWDHRNVRDALPGQTLPSARTPQVGHNFPQPQQASQRMNQAIYPGAFETDLEDDKYRRRR